jgi:hypothetical protein
MMLDYIDEIGDSNQDPQGIAEVIEEGKVEDL